MGENQQMVERLRSQNQDIEKQVKQMVRERENEDRIRKLEDGMKYFHAPIL
jgi:TolA-binding protein